MGLFGLFGSKKPEKTAQISAFFSAEDLQRIREVIEPKVNSNAYGKYTSLAQVLLDAVKHPEMTVSPKDLVSMNSVLGAVGAMRKMEPGLKDILNAAIEKMRAFRD